MTKPQYDAFVSDYAALCAKHGLAIRAAGALTISAIGGSEDVSAQFVFPDVEPLGGGKMAIKADKSK